MTTGITPAGNRAMFLALAPQVTPEALYAPDWVALGSAQPTDGAPSWTNDTDQDVYARWAAYLPDGRLVWSSGTSLVRPGNSFALAFPGDSEGSDRG